MLPRCLDPRSLDRTWAVGLLQGSGAREELDPQAPGETRVHSYMKADHPRALEEMRSEANCDGQGFRKGASRI